MFGEYTEYMTGPRWKSNSKSLLSALLDNGVPAEKIVLAERTVVRRGAAGRFDLAYWCVSSDGFIETKYAVPGKTPRTWQVIETPSYTGNILEWDNPRRQRG